MCVCDDFHCIPANSILNASSRTLSFPVHGISHFSKCYFETTDNTFAIRSIVSRRSIKIISLSLLRNNSQINAILMCVCKQFSVEFHFLAFFWVQSEESMSNGLRQRSVTQRSLIVNVTDKEQNPSNSLARSSRQNCPLFFDIVCNLTCLKIYSTSVL